MDVFATAFAALYAGHHAGDYWIQTQHQAVAKGAAGWPGRLACVRHVLSYTATQGVFLALALSATGQHIPGSAVLLALAVSAVTHYLADRRERGLMLRLARAMPWKRGFAEFGAPRAGRDDNPHLATGAWALDQSWHITLGCFLPALILSGTMSG